MRIAQTLWSAQKNLLENNFDWATPQYHIMGWALSCLKLREYYQDLHLYTDTNGYQLLIEQLGLPYTSVSVCYDNLGYHGNLWSFAKILTYARQEVPFLHVDGDIFIWEKFDSRFETAPLIAQNLEEGTQFYGAMWQEVKDQLRNIPAHLSEDLNRSSIPAYNAGLIGGNDVAFFHQLATDAIAAIRNNYEDPRKDLSGSLNVILEQVHYYSLARKQGKKVCCHFQHTIKDNGYMRDDIADLSAVPHQLKYLHLIGRNKRKQEVCDLLSRTLFKEYPDYFNKIVALFPKEHFRFIKKDKKIPSDASFIRTRQAAGSEEASWAKDLHRYESTLATLTRRWNKIPEETLYSIEHRANQNLAFFFAGRERQLGAVLERNPFLEAIETSHDWTDESWKPFSDSVTQTPRQAGAVVIGCVPAMFFKGYDEFVIDDLSNNILSLLDTPTTFKELLDQLEGCFSKEDIKNDYASFYELTRLRLKHLHHHKCIFIS